MAPTHRPALPRFRPRALAVAIATALASAPATAELPVKAVDWLVAGKVVDQVVGNTLELHQSTTRAILQWDSFDIGPDNTVEFVQPDRGSATLNRVLGGAPSEIFGKLKSNGQVFLLNRNGVVFKRGSQTQVHGIYASTLNVTDEVFEGGILEAAIGREAAFVPFEDGGGNPLPSADLEVESGASLRVTSGASGGFIRLFAPNVENAGELVAPDGQVAIGAGDRIYLAASSSDDYFRGLLVEVDGDGTATNLGEILTARGNASIIGGLAVNQQGRVTATSSVALNGSVRLMARKLSGEDSATGNPVAPNISVLNQSVRFFPDRDGTANYVIRNGKVTLGPGSVTEVLPELDPADTALDSQAIAPSRIEIQGQQVHLQGGSQVLAPNGEVSIDAVPEPGTLADLSGAGANLVVADRDPAARVQIDAGATVDVAGNSAAVPMSSNALTVRLFSSQLRNSPVQLDGPLRGADVTVDVRKGTPLADLSGELEGFQRSYAERTTAGGSVTLRAAGEIRALAGARIDISGGTVTTAPGAVGESLLVTADGRIVPISEADPGTHYRGVLDPLEIRHDKWRLDGFDPTERYDIAAWYRMQSEPGYTTGGDAGSIRLAAPVIVFDAEVAADVTRGEYQRDLAALPRGGELVLGLSAGIVAGAAVDDYLAPEILLAPDKTPLSALEFATTVAAQAPARATRTQLDPTLLTTAGITRLELNSNVGVTIAPGTALELAPGSTVAATAPRVLLADGITTAGGEVALATVDVNPTVPGLAPATYGLTVAAGVTVDVSGEWTNDSELLGFDLATAPPRILGAGSIVLDARHAVAGRAAIDIGNDVHFALDGGASLANDGRLLRGDGGELAVLLRGADGRLRLGANADWHAIGADQGGTLRLTANSILVGGSDDAGWAAGQELAAGDALLLPPALFGDHGFQTFAVRANDGALAIADGAAIDIRVRNRVIGAESATVASGASLDAVGTVERLPDHERGAAAALFVVGGSTGGAINSTLTVGRGASLSTDPGGTLALVSGAGGTLAVAGQLRAPAGSITLSARKLPENGVLGELPDTLAPYAVGEGVISNFEFVRTRSLSLGPDAVLDTRGVVVTTPNDLGVATGRVLAGGDVTLTSNGFLYLARGSLIDTSGASAELTLVDETATLLNGDAGASRLRIDSAGGDVILRSAEGGLLDGTLRGAAGGPGALGGTLAITVDNSLRNVLGIAYPDQPHVIRIDAADPAPRPLTDTAMTAFDGRVTARADLLEAPMATAAFGTLELGAPRLASWDFDGLALTTGYATTATSLVLPPVTRPGSIRFAGDVSLARAHSIALSAPIIAADDGTQITLSAPYVLLGSASDGLQSGTGFDASAGDGRLTVDAGFVQLRGSTAFQGLGAVHIRSASDIRLRPNATQSRLVSVGLLELSGLLYPTSFTTYTLSAADLVLGGGAPADVLSVGGQLNLVGTNSIVHRGMVAVPFGTVSFAAPDIRLAAGSVTSVAGPSLVVPGGETQGSQASWFFAGTEIYSSNVQTVPAKAIDIRGARVDVAAGATLDLDGGGTVQLHEYLPAPGGSAAEDPLLAANATDTYALLPALDGAVAPFDRASWAGLGNDDIALGQTLRVTASTADLAAGDYLVLPARYALLPGAVLVTRERALGNLAIGTTRNLADGRAVFAGFEYVAGTAPRPALADAWSVQSRDFLLATNDYLLSSASDLVAQRAGELELRAPRLPADAGRLVIGASDTLALHGSVRGDAFGARAGLELDLFAPQLALTAPGVTVPGFVGVDTATLAAIGAESILFGGTRSIAGSDLHIRVESENIRIDGSARLAGSELMFAAHQGIRSDSGALLDSRGPATGNTPFESIVIDQPDTDGNPLQRVAEGAFMRLSVDPRVPVRRTQDVGAPAPGNVGALDLRAGSTLAVSGSLTLDAVADSVFDARFIVTGGSVGFSSTRISLGQTAGRGIAQGLVLDTARLADIAADELVLASATTLDLYGAFAFGTDTLVLESAGLAGYDNAGGTVTISAGSMTLANPAGRAYVPAGAPDGTGTLALNARELRSGDGTFDVRGFDLTTATLAAGLVATGQGALAFAGDADLTTPRVIGANGATLALDVSGALGFAYHPGSGAVPASGLGASLAATAATIDIDTVFDLPAGDLAFTATGGGTALTLGKNALLAVPGTALLDNTVAAPFAGESILAYAPAGSIKLTTTQGDVDFDPAAILDASALADPRIARTPGAAPIALAPRGWTGELASTRAGDITLVSGGGATLAGLPRLFAGGGATAQGGALTIEAERLGAALPLADFGRAVHLRVRNSDLAWTQAVTTRDFQLVADGGSVTLAADVEAGGAERGRIAVYAATDVDVAAGVDLSTRASAAGSRGGDIVLSAGSGMVTLAADSQLDLSGAGGAAGGRLVLRAQRNGSGVKVAPIADRGRIVGATSIDIQAVKGETNVSALAGALSTAQTYAGNANAIATTLGLAGDSRYRLLPEIDIAQAGNVTFSTTTDLNTRSFAGVLSVRAGGDLTLNATVSDGFQGTAANSKLLGGTTRDSWSLRFVSGADLASADPLAVEPLALAGVATTRNLAIGSNRILRTGNGNLDLAASGSITLASNTSVVYVAGRSAGLELDRFATGFTGPSRWVPTGGGDLTLHAGGDLRGPTAQTQTFQEWYLLNDETPGNIFARGTLGGSYMNFATFQQNFGVFGGGDLVADIGRDADRVSLSVPSWLYLDSLDDGGKVLPGDTIERVGAGNLELAVGRNLGSSQLLVGDGHARADVRGRVTPTTLNGVTGLSWFGVQAGAVEVTARRDLTVQSVVDPAMVRSLGSERAFVSYGPESAFTATAIGGNLAVTSATNATTRAKTPNASASAFQGLWPAQVALAAPGGSVSVNRTAALSLMASPLGNLDVVARQDIDLFSNALDGGITLNSLDPPPARLHDLAAFVLASTTGDLDLTAGIVSVFFAEPASRADDPTRARLVARDGSVLGPINNVSNLNLSEAVFIAAGEDVRNLNLVTYHPRASDLSTVVAGRDVLQTNRLARLQVGGGGLFEVLAGRDIDLGQSNGILTVGDTRIPGLANDGADLLVAAGLGAGPGYDAFIRRYFIEGVYKAQLAGTTQPGDPFAFAQAPRRNQLAAIAAAFYDELRLSGVDATTSGSDDYSRAYAAIDTLFPGDAWAGDLSLLFSRVQTVDGGDIDLLVPGGSINAGLAVTPVGAPDKQASELGIVAIGTGSVNAYLGEDFLVNQSRVFTLRGGDIMLFSAAGNIDAGRGAKSSLSAPEPQVVIAQDGSVSLDFSGAISGSGIRTVATGGGRAGSVFLFAPQGVVNAGEAGIGGENVFIGATEVIGANNIDVGGGVAVGVPASSSVSIAAGVAGAADSASAAAQSATEAATQQSAAGAGTAASGAAAGPSLSVISVEVLGFGG